MTHIVHATLGSNRNARRFWQEGPRLALAGFDPGQRYSVRMDIARHRLQLTLRPDGERKVSGRLRRKAGGVLRPIIDIAGAVLERVFGPGVERVRVIYRPGEIEVMLPPLAVAQARREASLVEKISAGRPLDVGSICGGAEILGHAVHTGLHETGIATRAALAVDIDPDGLDVAVTANPATRGVALSVQASLDEVEPEIVPKLDVLLVTLPCTATSLAGRAHGRYGLPEEDPDVGHLVVSALGTFVRASEAGIVVAENVPQWRTSASGALWRTQMARYGYRLFDVKLYGPDFGAMEERERWACVGFSQGIAPEIFGVPAEPGRPRSVADILEPVPYDDERWRERAYLDAHAARHAAAGNHFKRNLVTPDAPTVGVMGRQYWKGRTTEPMLTGNPLHPDRSRLFTPVENARLRGCPEDLAAAVVNGRSPTAATELLGQSGTWPAFAALGRAVGRVLQTLARPNVTALPAARAPRPEPTRKAPRLAGGFQQLSLAI